MLGGLVTEVAHVLCLAVPTRLTGDNSRERARTALRTMRATGAARAQGQEGLGAAWNSEVDVEVNATPDLNTE